MVIVLALFPPSVVRCKYSVRDVAFVDVHGPEWQLQLIKPADVDAGQFAEWNQCLREQLSESNLPWLWLDAESEAAQRLLDLNPIAGDSRDPGMFLVNTEGQSGPVMIPWQDAWRDQLAGLVESETRTRMLDLITESLCVVVLVDSENKSESESKRLVVETAIETLNRQLWTLDKATERGPALIHLRADQQGGERWLLHSLGIRSSTVPQVAVVFGQGRRLGNVLGGEPLTVDSLVERMRICGQDCECSLDPDWLYGPAMLHRWSLARERAAELSLDFDPHSGWVVAEVAQIIRKHSNNEFAQPGVELRGGLVIHDLDSLPRRPERDDQQASAQPVPEIARHSPGVMSGTADLTTVADGTQESGFAMNSIQMPTTLVLLLGGVGLVLVIVVVYNNRKH